MSKAKLILFDLDGTLYLDGVLFPGVRELIHKLRNSSLEYGFLTNNSRIAPRDYLLKLRKTGLELEQRNVVTSSEAACLMLRRLGYGPRIYVFGTRKLRNFMEKNGFEHTAEQPSAILIGFDTEVTYRKMTEVFRLAKAGVPVLATHPDPVCPGDWPDCGMLLEWLKAGLPELVLQAMAGKPHRWVVELLQERFGVSPDEVIMVGDRVQTDMRFAQNFGMRSIMVLNGVPQPPLGDVQPTLIVPRIAQLNDEFWPENLGWC